jgi:hypothetical protein
MYKFNKTLLDNANDDDHDDADADDDDDDDDNDYDDDYAFTNTAPTARGMKYLLSLFFALSVSVCSDIFSFGD